MNFFRMLELMEQQPMTQPQAPAAPATPAPGQPPAQAQAPKTPTPDPNMVKLTQGLQQLGTLINGMPNPQLKQQLAGHFTTFSQAVTGAMQPAGQAGQQVQQPGPQRQ